MAGGKDYAYFHNVSNREANVITISASGAYAGYVNFWREKIFASDCTTVVGKKNISYTEFIFNYLLSQQEQIYYLQKGSAQPHVYPKDIAKIPIPLPPLSIQKQIIDECAKVDEEYNNSRMSIESYRQKIANVFERLEVVKNTKSGGVIKLSDKQIFTLSIGKRVVAKEMIPDGKYPVYSANMFEPFGYIDKLLLKDFNRPSVVWGIDGDWQVNIIPANIPFYPTDHCGVMRINSDIVNPRYMAWALRKAGDSMRFSRDYRASLDRIRSISLTIPSKEEQDKAMTVVTKLELRILEAQNVMALCNKRKKAILKKYLY